MPRSEVAFASASPSSGSPEEPLRPEREHERDQDEREDDRVPRAAVVARDRQVRGREGEDERVGAGPGGRPEQRSHAADDHDHERVQQPLRVLARGDVALRGADGCSQGRQGGADDERDRPNVFWMLIPSAEVICGSSTPARITLPSSSVEPEPQSDPDRD